MDFICFSTQHKIHWPGFPLSQGLGFNYRYFHIPGHEDFAAAFPLLFLGIVWLSHLALHWEFTSRCQVHMNELLFWELQKEKKNPLNKLLNSFCWTIPQVAGVNAFTKLADCKCRACFACAAKEFKGGEQKRSPVSSTQSPSPMWARPLLCSACHSEYLSCISPRSRLTVKWRSNLWLPLLRSLSCSQACKNSNNNLSHFSLLYHPIGERARSILQGLHVHLSVSITYRGSLTLSESDEVYRHLIHCRNTLPRLDTTSGKAFINTRPMVFIYHRPIANEREERKTTPCVSSGSILEGPGWFHGASTDAHRLAAVEDHQYRVSGVIQQVIVPSKSFALAKVTRTVSARCAILKPWWSSYWLPHSWC